MGKSMNIHENISMVHGFNSKLFDYRRVVIGMMDLPGVLKNLAGPGTSRDRTTWGTLQVPQKNSRWAKKEEPKPMFFNGWLNDVD